MIKRYKKRPVIIQAVQFINNDKEIEYFVNDGSFDRMGNDIFIDTLEGLMEIKHMDYVIKGIKGEFYPCKPDIFEASYEEVE